MSTTTARRVTRQDREHAAAAAGEVDLRPVGRVAAMLGIFLALAVVVPMLAPDPTRFGGPLQDGNVVAGATLTPVRRADGVVTVGVFVPWNAGGSTAVLEGITPVEIEGDVEVVETSLLPPGLEALEPIRGLPETALRVEEAPMPPGTGPLDTVQVAVSLRGRGSVLGFLLHYRVGSSLQHAFLMNGVMLCERACKERDVVAERQRALARVVVGFVDGPDR